MELKQQFEKVMGESVNMALATCVENQPNVRVVTFAFDNSKGGRLFFSTFKGNQKTKEFQHNPNVSCMPLPMGPESEIQVRIFGTVKKSNTSLDELIAMIAKKIPGDADTIKDGGDMMEIYEVCFENAYVTVGMTQAQLITF